MNKNIKYLIESIVNFNPADYEDDEQNIIDNDTIHNVIHKYFPKTKQ